MAERQQYEPVGQAREPTYENSAWASTSGLDNLMHSRNPAAGGPASTSFYESTDSFLGDSHAQTPSHGLKTSGYRATEMKIMAVEMEDGAPVERPRDYRGRYRVRHDLARCVRGSGA